MSEHKHNCKALLNKICDNLGEDMKSPKCEALKQEIESCETCKQFFTSVEKTIGLYKEYNVEVTDESHKKLMKLLDLDEFC